VIDLSKRILFSEGLSIASDSESSAFLFDVSMLFEYFIRKLFIRNGLYVHSKFENNLKIPTGVRDRKLEPDIVVQTEEGLLVLDVKYKHFDNQKGVKREDLFQMHTYVGQYANDNNVLGFGLIYPSSSGKNHIIKENTKL
jgi:5-methylcytosine-specific restriction endonuclease McrBC regulatory subunit McrC